MQANEVVVFPDKDTSDYFSQVFATCPFDINIESFHVTLNETQDQCILDPNRVYTATCGLLGYWYDEGLGCTNLILPLVSDDLLTRMAELRVTNGAMFHSQPLPFMVIKNYMPPLSRHYRTFVTSIANILLDSQQPLVFTGETQVYKDYEFVPYKSYYDDVLHQ